MLKIVALVLHKKPYAAIKKIVVRVKTESVSQGKNNDDLDHILQDESTDDGGSGKDSEVGR